MINTSNPKCGKLWNEKTEAEIRGKCKKHLLENPPRLGKQQICKPLPPLEILQKRFTFVNGVLVNKITKGRMIAGKKAGTLHRRSGYVFITIDGKAYKLHRILWKLHYGADPNGILHHKNNIRSDNAIENLELSNTSRNAMTRSVANSNTGQRGVFWNADQRVFDVRIQAFGKQCYVGKFAQLYHAKKARAVAESVLFSVHVEAA